MRRIKKAIDIIIILIAISVIIVLADRIIPISINKNVYVNQVTNADRDTGGHDPDRNSAGAEKALRLEMTIDNTMFTPERDIFAAAPASNTKEDIEKQDFKNTGSEQQELIKEDQNNYPNRQEIEEVAENNEETNQQEESIDYSNSSDFRIEVDLENQRALVFHRDEILKEMICSGGAPESPTPQGEYVTYEKIEYAWVERFGVGAYYWIRFFEDYLIHSVPFDEDGVMIVEEFEKLGNPASHGCIRLRLEEAKWLYEMLPLGVKVVIYQ